MTKSPNAFATLFMAASMLALLGCGESNNADNALNPIVGAWFVKNTGARTTRQFVSRGEISYEIKVIGNTFTGSVTARSYDANDTLIDGPSRALPLEGKRVTFP
jgi:hypothetical protein